jgi:hypothetical protein
LALTRRLQVARNAERAARYGLTLRAALTIDSTADLERAAGELRITFVIRTVVAVADGAAVELQRWRPRKRLRAQRPLLFIGWANERRQPLVRRACGAI